MARFARGTEHLELLLAGATLVETTLMTAARTLHDERAAQIAYYLRNGEILEAGWRRTSRFVDDLLPEPPLPFEPEGDAERAVLRDSLIERGDPRGELAALRAGRPDARALGSLEKTRGIELFGLFALLPRAWRDQIAFGWRDGWIDEIAVSGSPHHEVVHAALHAPMARFARTLTLDESVTLEPCACLARITRRSRD